MNPRILSFDPLTHYVVCTHQDPDPDGTGALLAFMDYAKKQGLNFSAYLDHYPDYMHFMPGLSDLQKHTNQIPEHFTLIALDCGQKSRLWPSFLLEKAATIWNIDHHIDNDNFGDINLVEKEYSSTCELVFELFETNSIPRSETMNYNLMSGIVFDTGGLRFQNVSPKTMEIVLRLMQEGISLAQVSEQVFCRWTQKSFFALMLALKNIEMFFEEQLILSWISYEEITEAKLTEADFEGIVQTLGQHCNARMVAFVREMQKGHFKGSLRSKQTFTVHDIAHVFDGGGHTLAAGFSTQKYSASALRDRLLIEAGKKCR